MVRARGVTGTEAYFRLDEIEKLNKFRVFIPMLRSLVPIGERIDKHRWVDTMEKSRLTVQDLKRLAIQMKIRSTVLRRVMLRIRVWIITQL